MATDEELLAIKERAAARLMQLPGITGVGVGGRVRAGERINEAVVKVYVASKRPPQQVDSAELIPTDFDGIPTDVLEMGTPALLGAPPGSPGGTELVDEKRWRPVRGGTSMQVALPGAGWGTLGCMLVANDDPSQPYDSRKAYALTAWHVLLGSKVGPPNLATMQSLPVDIPPVIGTTRAGQNTNKPSNCCDPIFGTVAGGGFMGVSDPTVPLRDAGVVALDPGIQWRAEIRELGAVTGPAAIGANKAANHVEVQKRGAKTGLTGGIIESISTATNPKPEGIHGLTFNNVIVVTPNSPNPPLAPTAPVFFVDHGDSGSALVIVTEVAGKENEVEVVGVVSAMEHEEVPLPGQTVAPYTGPVRAFVFPIEEVIKIFEAEGLKLTVALAKTTGETHTVPGAAMVALAPEVLPTLAAERPSLAHRTVSKRERVRVPVASMAVELPPQATLAQLQRELDCSERGGALMTLWLTHQAELLRLLNSNRRVATVWHRSGASALVQILLRMLTQPELRLPRTLNGDPVSVCIERVCLSIERYASPALKRDLTDIRTELPEFGGRSLNGILAALGAQ